MKYHPYYPALTQTKAASNGSLGALRIVMKPQPPKGWFIMERDTNLPEYFWTERDEDDDMMGWFPSYDHGLAPSLLSGDILYLRSLNGMVGLGGPVRK